jgi:hypothetical protein
VGVWGSFTRTWLGFDGDLDPPDDPTYRTGIAAPPDWGDGSELAKLWWSDVFGPDVVANFGWIDRHRALGVPALLRARNLLCTTIARMPLQALRTDEVVDPQPGWTTRTDGTSSPFHRMTWTVDDLLFYEGSLWRGERTADGREFLTLTRVPYHRWNLDDTGREFIIDEAPANQDDLVFIPGFSEGILVTSQTAIRTAADLSAQAADSARVPFKLELHQTTADVLTDDEISALIRRAREALASNSGVLYTNAAVEARVHPVDAQQLLIDGRNASAVDMARIASLPAALVDATTAGASLTYETTQGRNQQAVDYGLAAYMAAVTSRLSLDDVVPRGQRVAFQSGDFQALTGNPTGPPVAD